MAPTQFEDVNSLLGELLKELQTVLGEKLVGLYLYGSLVWGDFDHDISDIDLLAATSEDINQEDLEALRTMHEDFTSKHLRWKDRIEIQYVSVSVLKTYKSSAEEGTLAAISPGDPLKIAPALKDYLMNWYSVMEKGITLFGPDPKTVIEPVSKEEFIQAVKKNVSKWTTYIEGTKHSRPYQAYAILTMCRALYAYKNGEQPSKKQAAEWAQKELPDWAPLIQDALSWRKDYRNENVEHEKTYPKTVEFVNFISKLIQE